MQSLNARTLIPVKGRLRRAPRLFTILGQQLSRQYVRVVVKLKDDLSSTQGPQHGPLANFSDDDRLLS